MTDEDIIDKYWKSTNVFKRYFNRGKVTQDELDYLDSRFDDSESIEETLWRIKHKVYIRPVCEKCGSKLKWNNGFPRFCSGSCRINQDKIKESIIRKYGVANVSQIPGVQNKIKETCIKRFGVTNAFLKGLNKSIQTRKEHKDEVQEKRRQTCLVEYGVDHVLKSQVIKDKIHETSKLKYGVEHFMQSEEVKRKYNWNEIIPKQIATKIKNGTLGGSISVSEGRIYEVLVKKFGEDDVIRQYKEKRYPWHCDFYVKSKDLFIEYQGFYTHYTEPFNPENIVHQTHLQTLIDANRNNYIKTWTINDVAKRNKAKENGLNYVEFWTLKEAIYCIEHDIFENSYNKIK